MDRLKQIQDLLEKFYEGSTSLEEEKSLKDFFLKEDVPQKLEADKEMFISMSLLEAPADIPDDLEEGIMLRIEKESRKEVRVRRLTIISLSGLAASILIVLSVYLGFQERKVEATEYAYTQEEAEDAYYETKKALAYMSSKWNESTDNLKPLNKVNTSLNSMSPLRKISSGSRELNLLGNLRYVKDI